jgi:hypothetical protein
MRLSVSRHKTSLLIEGDARFSDCGKYRYRLWRTWDETKPAVVYIMLNPSVANSKRDDATITRCIRRAQRLGAGGIFVMNLFAFVATKRAEIYRVPDPVGPESDTELLDACVGALHVICGWGNDGHYRGRDRQVLKLLRANGIQPKAVRITKKGAPGHPLYVAYDRPPIDID